MEDLEKAFEKFDLAIKNLEETTRRIEIQQEGILNFINQLPKVIPENK
jgi:hypothetical protein